MRKSFALWTTRGKTFRPVAFEFLRDEWPLAMEREVIVEYGIFTLGRIVRFETSALRFLDIEEEITS